MTALSSVLEYLYCSNSKLKTESNINDLEYLGTNARAHYARLFHVRNRLQYVVDEAAKKVALVRSKKFTETLAVFNDLLQKNAKHHLTTHQKMYAFLFGGDTRHTDTELGEALHKLVALLPYLRCNRSQKFTSHDCMKWLMIQKLIEYNAMKYGIAPERTITLVPTAVDEGCAMNFVVARTTSSQFLVWQPHPKSGRPLLYRLADGRKYGDGLSFAHSRIGDANFFDFLNLKSNRLKIPHEVDWIRFVTQTKCLGDHQPHGVGEFQVRACPRRLAYLRASLPAEHKVEQYNYVLVAYEDDDGNEPMEVGMVVAIINYQLTATGLQDTRFVIAWTRDADNRRDVGSPCPYPVKQLIVTDEGEGGAVRGGNRFHLNIIEPHQIREPVFLVKQVVRRGDQSLAFANGHTHSWEMFKAERYYYISHARMTAAYHLDARDLKMKYPKVFFVETYFKTLNAMLERPLPSYVISRFQTR